MPLCNECTPRDERTRLASELLHDLLRPSRVKGMGNAHEDPGRVSRRPEVPRTGGKEWTVAFNQLVLGGQ